MRRMGVARHGGRALAALATLALAALPVQAQWTREALVPGVGLPVPMPATPRTADLVAFDMSAASQNRFAIDPTSVRPEGERFVRLTMVVTSSGGASNISYEAFDCERWTHRLLAIGHADGSWRPIPDAQWLTVRSTDRILRQHLVVFNAACEGGKRAGDTKRIVRRLTAPTDERYLR